MLVDSSSTRSFQYTIISMPLGYPGFCTMYHFTRHQTGQSCSLYSSIPDSVHPEVSSCRKGRIPRRALAPPRGHAVTMSISNISHAPAPNPCTNALFQPPIYSFSNVSVAKTFVGDYGNFRGTFDFTVRDAANNYSLHCSWGRGEARGYAASRDDWGWMNCVDPVTGIVPPSESRVSTLLNLDSKALLENKSLQSPVRIAQYWYCDVVGGAYPEAYQARADILWDIACPGTGKRDTAVSCNITQPVTTKAQWIPRGVLFPGTPRLEHRPTAPPTTRGIDPPPSRDCTDVSFAYPDWTLNDFAYKQPISWDNPAATASLNLSLTSRATGSRVRCRWGADVGVTKTWVVVSDYTMIPVCTPEAPDPLHSNGVFLIRFNAAKKVFYLEQNWVCGDTAGTYSTNFTARTANPEVYEITLPLYCSSGICTVDSPFRVKGRLTSPVELSPAPLPPPEGASTPNCLWNSQRTGGQDSPLGLSRFLWQATTVRTTTHYPGYEPIVGQPSSFNRTLQVEVKNAATNVTTACAFTDPVLDGETDRWWPCFRDRASQDEHMAPLRRAVETWVQFSAKTGQVRVNQTWYCSSPDGGAAPPYRITAQGRTPAPRGNGLASLLCGDGNNTWYTAPCPPVIFGPSGDSCDYTYHARWCTLGDRNGGLNAPWFGPLVVPTENVDVVRLPAGDLTEPAPAPEVWSCTTASLGRGPVVWALQQSGWVDFFAQTDWFDVLSSYHPDVLTTWFEFNLNSSVFAGFPPTALSKDGVVRDLGVRQEVAGRALTPWMRTFDPTRVFTDRAEYPDISNPGWKFYNALGWSLRFDISAGYMELNHSWYCDDKDPERPVVFNGTWNGYVPLTCGYEFPGPRTGDITRQGVTCRLAGGGKEFVVLPTVTHAVSESKIPYRVPHWCCS
ncbi:hypothetical protein B0T25DRAFT_358152 [Lasiosphaeria hispida]|uniref:Uncharacterized protein n=1 Tax=Lasiosphaeria hispida TaxID=260671 RepID=A0AAJ0H894_9PEZI|nr:hypothetical protein B0T25DRAFT_358152 [Lasiosphaeria hispida]